MTPAVSVIVPAHNAAPTLERTLRAALSQTVSDIEVIVVDDGSSDGTADVASSLAREDSRLRLIGQANAGVAAARNAGLAAARAALVAPLDADDLWHPEKLERQAAHLEAAGSAAGMAYCWSVEIDGADRVVQHRRDVDRYEGDCVAPLIVSNFVGNGSVPLMRTALVRHVGGWAGEMLAADAQGCEDWLLYLKMARCADIALTPAFLVGYRQSAGAMSRSMRSMRRSHGMVLREAQRDAGGLPRCLFRWSRAEFLAYEAEMRLETPSHDLAAAASFARAVALDPSWAFRPSTRRRLTRLLANRIGLARRQDGSRTGRGSGIAFGDVVPDLDRPVSEGDWIARRRRFLAGIKSRHAAM